MRLIDADALDYELGTSDRDIYVRECLAEAPSVVVEPHWIPFEKRQLTDEEKIDHPDWEYILDGEYPEDGQEVLITNGLWVTQDTFFCDGECYFDGGIDVEDVIAWMPLPEPYKGVTE